MENEDLEFVKAISNIAHGKALLVLYWQEREELNHQIPVNYKLQLFLKWMNCAPFERHLHEKPSQHFSVNKEKNQVNLYDYDCVPDNFRDWCVDVTGRNLSFSYILEKRFGNSLKMEIICDSKIERIERKSWSYGLAGALFVLTGAWIMKKKKENESSAVISKYPDETPPNHPPLRQNPKFLTVPLRVRHRPERSRIKQPGADYAMRSLLRVGKSVKPPTCNPSKKFEIPKIVVYEPDE